MKTDRNVRHLRIWCAFFALFFGATLAIGQTQDLVQLELARKIATFECQRMYGNFPEFDQLTYLDSDGSPAVYVFVFQQNNRFVSKEALRAHILPKYQDGRGQIEIIRRGGDGDREKLYEARKRLREAYDDIWLADDFISIYVSATKSRAAIPEERRGLPEAYTHRWEGEGLYQEAFGRPSAIQEYYYFGPLDVFFRGAPGATRLFNVYEKSMNLSSDSLALLSYRIDPTARTAEDLQHLNAQWSFWADSLNQDTWAKYLRRETDEMDSLTNVPDFRQLEFLNIFPDTGTCAVMASGSAFGYYDQLGYWNLCDLAYHSSGIYPQGGFYEYPGFPASGPAGLIYAGGIDEMLYNIALSVGYVWHPGYTRTPLVRSGLMRFANDARYGNNLDFQIDSDPIFPCLYSTIQNRIENGDPVLVSTSAYDWQSGPRPYTQHPRRESHTVIIFGYDTNMGNEYEEGIYVRLNGSGPLGPVKWDYSDLENRWTWEFTDGGSPGTFLPEPSLQSPANGSTVGTTVNFDWSDVAGANLYWLQIATNSSFNQGVQNPQTTSSSYSTTLTPGTYYWHVVARNGNNNWCHFSDISSFTVSAGPPPTLWTQTFGGSNYDCGYSVQQTSDSGYVIAGYTLSFGAGSYDVYLIKTDAAGNQVWQRTFGGIGYDIGFSVQQTSDGGYIIAGQTGSYGAGADDVYLIKTDAAGIQTWQRTFGGSSSDGGYSVQQTSDSGYVIAGYTISYGAGADDVYLIKTDAAGIQTWQRTFGGSSYDAGLSVQQTSDGGYVISGYTDSYGAGYLDVYLIKTDAAGIQIWQRTFGGSSYDDGYSVQQTSDGGYIIAGHTDSYGAGEDDVYLIKTDAAGIQTWQRTFGGSGYDVGYSVQQTSDGGHIIAGYTDSYGAGSFDVYLIKTDGGGNLQWQQTFGGSSSDHGMSVQQTSDGGYIIAGRTGAGQVDVYLIKTAPETVVNRIFGLPPEAQVLVFPTEFTLRQNYPNPFNATTILSYELPVASYVKLEVFDITGRLVGAQSAGGRTPLPLVNGWREAGRHEVTFDGSGLPSGIYIYRMEASGSGTTPTTMAGKMILLK